MALTRDELEHFAHIRYTAEQKDAFRCGTLGAAWSECYPMLFDVIDRRTAENQARLGYHFVEWLTAVHLLHVHGLFTLQASYPYKTHKAKGARLEAIAGPEVMAFFRQLSPKDYFQAPDLFVYAPDGSEWFFCEVKGPSDHLRDTQLRFFERLIDATGAKVKLVTLEMMRVPSNTLAI